MPEHLTYNNNLMSSDLKNAPLEARKKDNEVELKDISLQAKRTRTYTELKVGDSVNMMLKKGIRQKKAHFTVE